ncbi:MAG: hypothetical protein AAGF58_03610 [Pseudomonadota bacterium]
MAFAEGLIFALQIYAGIGAVVAAAFLLIGVDRIDPGSRGSYLFRVLVLPGVIGLWPLVLWRWWALEQDGVGGAH